MALGYIPPSYNQGAEHGQRPSGHAVRRHDAAGLDTEFTRGLGLYDATMVVVGSMIGSGIFIVSADIARLVGSPGWLLLAWVVTGALTVTAALSYGELAAMMPRAGGQYVYLREAFSPLWGFLYGWTLFLVIQTGTIAAVAVAFGRFLGVLWPAIAETHYLVPPIHLSTGYAVSLSTAQLVGLVLIALLTWTNTRGLDYGKIIQNVFTTAKTGALAALIAIGLVAGWNALAVDANFGDLWTPRGNVDDRAGADGGHGVRAVRRRVRGADRLAVLGRRLEQHHLHRRRGEEPAPQHPAVAGAGHRHRHRPLPAGQRRLSGDAAARRHPERAGGPRRHGDARRHLPRARRAADGQRDHRVDVRLLQRPDPRRGPRLLRDGARRRVLHEAPGR